MFSCTHNYSCLALYTPAGPYPCLLLYPLRSSRFPQITEQILHKSPKKISSNHRTNLPQTTEKSAFSLDKQAVTSLQSSSSYTLQVKYIAAVALHVRRVFLVRSTLLAAPLLYTLHSSFTRALVQSGDHCWLRDFPQSGRIRGALPTLSWPRCRLNLREW